MRFRAEDPIQLRIPGGQVKNTHIVAVEFLSGPGKSRPAFMLPRDISNQGVPEGTEIWLARTNEESKKK
jgi:hypothetical protein